MIRILTDETFESEIVNSCIPAVVKFGSESCKPCNMVRLIMDNIMRQFQEKMIFAELDVEQYPQKTSEMGIMNIPTILFFQDGQIVDSVIGSISKEKLLEKINGLFS